MLQIVKYGRLMARVCHESRKFSKLDCTSKPPKLSPLLGGSLLRCPCLHKDFVLIGCDLIEKPKDIF